MNVSVRVLKQGWLCQPRTGISVLKIHELLEGQGGKMGPARIVEPGLQQEQAPTICFNHCTNTPNTRTNFTSLRSSNENKH